MDDLDLGATIKGFIAGQKVFNRYTLIRILGRGGMGVVWLARDEELEREVALKFLPEVVALDKEAIRDLKRETRRSLELTHPHIVRIYDFVQDAHTAAISMEYVAGETLAAKKVELAEGHFEVTTIREWVRQWLDAMEYAHAQAKVAHRDLKPANLMIDGQGWLKVTDFGIAASMSDTASRVSNQFGSSGTPVYMSPQQMMGEKPAVTDDIYAIGATLYELLTGKPPFYSGNVLMQVQNKVPPSLAERRTDLGVSGEPIPLEWEDTIAACLAKEPSDRPQNAGEVLQRLGIADGGVRSVPAHFRNKTTDGASKSDKVERAFPKAPAAAPSTVPNPSSKVHAPTPKTPLYVGIVAGIVFIGLAAWYFGLHAPEQRRIETERLRVEQARIDDERLQAEREAEAQRQEQARLAAARGGIIVRTNPSGAEVRVGAVALDKSPLNLRDQRLGKYPVQVRLDGYEDWNGEVEVKADEFAELSVTLARKMGTLVLTSAPAALEVEVTGRDASGAPPLTTRQLVRTPAELQLATGGYQLTFRRSGWPDQSRTVEISSGEATAVEVEMLGGGIEIASMPLGLDFVLEGQGRTERGRTPAKYGELPVGDYTVTINREGWPRKSQPVAIKRGEQVKAQLEYPAGGTLKVSSTPPGAEVWLQDRKLGVTPLNLSDFPPGMVGLELRRKFYQPGKAEGNLTPSGQLELSANLAKNVPEMIAEFLQQYAGTWVWSQKSWILNMESRIELRPGLTTLRNQVTADKMVHTDGWEIIDADIENREIVVRSNTNKETYTLRAEGSQLAFTGKNGFGKVVTSLYNRVSN